MTSPTRFVFLLIPDFSHIAFSCAIEPLRIANLLSGKTLYEWVLASENGENATCSNGSVTLVNQGLVPLNRHDNLFVISGIDVHLHITTPVQTYLRREKARGTQIGAICSATYLLAKTGMLDNTSAAIHWDFHDQFIEEFPDVHLSRNVFIANQPIITASGGTAAADLMLHLIAKSHGEELATDIADQMVYNAVREAGAEQRISVQSKIGTRNPHLAKAIRMMEASVEDPVSPTLIAEEIGISTRQLERLFGRYLGVSPKKFLMDLRLQKAQRLLVQTELSVTEVAMACGFSSSGHFSRVYRTQFGHSPVSQRSRIG